MSTKFSICGVCEYRNTNTSSVVWCSECDEGLCRQCKEHHTASRATRDHNIVPISEYQKLPSNISEISQTCPKHNEKYKIFCKKHDSPCCRRCVVETHANCGELNAIADVIRNVKSSNAFLEMEQGLDELLKNLKIIRRDRQNNIKSLKKRRTAIEKEIQQTRVFINTHLDKLQENLTKELYATKDKEHKKIISLMSSIQEKERDITEFQTNLDKIKQQASDLQTFLAMKYIQQDVTKTEKFIESLLTENMNHITLSFEKEKALETLLSDLHKMGTIILDTRSCDITLSKRKNKEAQIMVPTTLVPTIDDITLTLRQTIKTVGENITDCSLLPDGRMMFSCYFNCQITVMKTDGSLDFTLQTRSYTNHIHYIEDSQKLVCTSCLTESITIIDMKNRKTANSIEVGSRIYGIVHRDGTLYYGHGRGISFVSLHDDSTTKLVNATLSQYSCIAIWSNQLYYMNIDDSVTCCDLQGVFKWKLELSFLKGARGITVDTYGRVYVSGYYSHNVLVISPDGNKHRVMLSEKDRLHGPQSLFFDRKNNKLLISNCDK